MSDKRIWCRTALLADGWCQDVVLMVDSSGSICEIVRGAGGEQSKNMDMRFDGAAVPGMPNLHSHAHQRAMAGLAERASGNQDSFWSWRQHMYQMVEKIDPEDIYHIASMLYVEMLEAGYTRVAEFQYLHHDPAGKPYRNRAEMTLQCRQAARDTGIGFTALPVVYGYGGFGSAPASAGQRRFINGVDEFAEIVENLESTRIGHERTGIAPHSLRAIDLPLLRSAIGSVSTDSVIHIHIAEQVKEVEDCVAWCGVRPVRWLLDHFDVDHRWCLIHATHMSPDEITDVAATGAIVGLCPTTEANLGDGFFAAREYLDQGGVFGIGSDSHITVDPAEELRLLEYGERLQRRQRAVLADANSDDGHVGVSLYRKAMAGGARACGLARGGLVEGMPADFSVLDQHHPRLGGKSPSAQLDSWVFASAAGAVSDVVVGGRQVIMDSHHPRGEQVREKYFLTLKKLHG